MAPASQAAHNMHELALMQSLVGTVLERVETEVALVRLEIGELAGVDAGALRFCFGVCAEGTLLAHADLDMIVIPARARCHACGEEQATRSFAAACTCGSFDRELLTGEEIRLKDVEVY